LRRRGKKDFDHEGNGGFSLFTSRKVTKMSKKRKIFSKGEFSHPSNPEKKTIFQ